MNNFMNRRDFVKKCTTAGAAFLAAPSIPLRLGPSGFTGQYEVRTVVGDKYFENTMKAVDMLGGMEKFVKKGSTVGILINSPWDTRGTFTNPDIALAVIKMCLDAGAKQIYTIHDTSPRYWRWGSLSTSMKSELDNLRHEDAMTEVSIERAKSLKSAIISQTLLTCGTYINLPIIKDHEGTRFTCSMKNVMGACSSATCRFFHYGGKLPFFSGAYANIDLLSQCIADVQLVRQPDLCVVDATEILTTNGPTGPGDIRKPREIIATTNCVASDMYAVRHLGLDPEELPLFKSTREHGLGPASLKDVHVVTA